MQLQSSRAVSVTAPGSKHFIPAPHVVAAVHGTDTALLDMRSERYYTLDAVGSRIWALIEGGASVDDIARRLGEEFDAPHDRIEHDLHALLEQLERAAIILPGAKAGRR